MSDKDKIPKNKLTANVKAAGCAAKLGAAELARILARVPSKTTPELIAGIGNFEDAAVYKISDDIAIVETLDFFPPMVDDPYMFGQIAAANALSDIYAMGARPIFALNIVGFPTCDFDDDVLVDILRGGASQVEAAGAVIAGGHSIQLDEPVYGLAVTGLIKPSDMLTNGGAKPFDKLVLSKPIGTGVGLLGSKAEMLSSAAQDALFGSLTKLNATGLDAGRAYSIHALTDITGFGLAGHLHEMSKGSGLKARLNIRAVRLLPEVLELARQGLVPAGAYGNRESYKEAVHYIDKVELEFEDLIFDPQTSGGLLFAVGADDADALANDLLRIGFDASVIGQMLALEGSDKAGLVEIVFK
ncbi:MAG: selenide, water dikinase SelD [Candidatus Melainabacteria bacterium]|nr:selenide, water dikinase SelD [Candidatus Melainabacteria bacterium]